MAATLSAKSLKISSNRMGFDTSEPDEEVEKLIDYYRDNEYLRNHNLAEYMEGQLKDLNLKSLSTLLPGRSVDEIKKEWTTLKTFSRGKSRGRNAK